MHFQGGVCWEDNKDTPIKIKQTRNKLKKMMKSDNFMMSVVDISNGARVKYPWILKVIFYFWEAIL